MAQAIGSRHGIFHGPANALCLAPALRFNRPVAGEEIARFGEALGSEDPIERTEELARLSGYERLRDFGVPEDELEEVAEATAERAGAKANPRPASPEPRSPSCYAASGSSAGAGAGRAARTGEMRYGFARAGLDAV